MYSKIYHIYNAFGKEKLCPNFSFKKKSSIIRNTEEFLFNQKLEKFAVDTGIR